VHFCQLSSTLFVADTYNHKIKIMTGEDGTINSETPIKDWVGVANEKNPSVVDGVGAAAILKEPNGCWALT